MAQTIDLRKKTEPEVVAPIVTPPPIVAPTKPMPPPQEAAVISWESTLSYIPPKKNAWYMLGALGIAAIAMIYFRHDILLGVILVLAGVVIVLRAYAKPQTTHISVGGSGMTIGNEKYFYHELKSFWLDYRPPHTKEISIEFQKKYRPFVRLPIETVNPLEIRAIMVQYIPEKEHEQSFLDHIARLIGI